MCLLLMGGASFVRVIVLQDVCNINSRYILVAVLCFLYVLLFFFFLSMTFCSYIKMSGGGTGFNVTLYLS